MLRFFAMSFTAVIGNLERATMSLHTDDMLERDRPGASIGSKALTTKALADVVKELEDVPVTNTVRLQAKRLQETVDTIGVEHGRGRAVATALMDQLKFNVINDLSAHLCLLIPDVDRWLWEQPTPLFGKAVIDRFPDATRDIAAAGRCLALDEPTASVFHLMRVLEIGLRDLANRVGHTFPTPVEYQEWGTVIEHIEARIEDTVKALPKRTAEKNDAAEFYNKAASQFWHFKDAWRNHVMHSRSAYDTRQARQVYSAVQALMEQLASNP
jgi:hypothetical protein